MKNVKDFTEFLSKEVNLNQSRIDTLNKKSEILKEFLSKNLEGYRKIEKQGSYALQTIIKPVQENDEFDADILVYIKQQEGWKAADYINAVYKVFQNNDNYSRIVRRKTRCVTIDYSGDFHVDLVPAIEINSKVYICNNEENKREETDGTGFRDWFNGKNKLTNGHLKRVTRLFKFLRDHKDNFSVKSILVCTLLGNAVSKIDAKEFTDLPTTLYLLFKEMENYLQSQQKIPTVSNPILPKENFNRHWDQKIYDDFREKIHIYFEKIQDAYDEEERNTSIKKWRKLFGEKFGTIIEQKNSNPVVKTSPQKPYAILKPDFK